MVAKCSNGNGHSNGHADSKPQYDFDVFTIGAGSGGTRASRIAAEYGARVAACELPMSYVSSEDKGGVGGTCVLRGCVPKKLMVYASEYADAFKQSVGFGWEDRGALPAYDLNTFRDAKRTELERLNSAYQSNLDKAKVTTLQGRGRVVGPHEVEVDGKRYTAGNIIIATGARPNMIKLPGAEHCINSDQILELDTLPKRMVVIGGGYIGVEFSCIFNRLGTDVHIVYRQDMPLAGFDNDCRKFLVEQYKQTGLNMYAETSPTEVKKQPDGRLTAVLKLKDGSVKELTDVDVVVMATGRNPNTESLNLKEVGVELGEKGQVKVDDYSRSSVPSIWAVGDVTLRVPLTPVAIKEGTALAKTIVLNEPTKVNHKLIPSAVFSFPEMSTVGLSEEKAIKEGHQDLDIYTSTFRPMRNNVSGSPLKSFMKIVVDSSNDKVLGVHYIGEAAAEVIQGFAVALNVGVTKTQIDNTVGVHPSSAEELVTMKNVARKIRGGKPMPEEEKKKEEEAQKEKVLAKARAQ